MEQDWVLPSAISEGRPAAMGFPLVHLSYAQSIDGRIATRTGDSRGLSSDESLMLTHQIRAESDAIMVGIGTVLADDPHLDCRLRQGCPAPALRVIADSHLRIPLESHIVRTARDQDTIVYCLQSTRNEPGGLQRLESLEAAGIMVGELPANGNGGINLLAMLSDLGVRKTRILFVEGGSSILTSFVAANLVDLFTIFLTPKLIGTGVDAFGGLAVNKITGAINLIPLWHRSVGSDLVWRLRTR